MKIDIDKVNMEHFKIKTTNLGTVEKPCIATLINPSGIDTKWTTDNLIFRSSVWDAEGELISAGYKKFFNWNEHPELVEIPDNIAYVRLHEKIDGSCLIVSRYRGNTIIRTRGTLDATLQDNGAEIAVLKEKYPKAFEFTEWTAGYSRIFEWTTPSNRIVLDYGDKPQLWYTGKIYHSDYRYASQAELDQDSICMKVQRPKEYAFSTMADMLTAVDAFKGVEGICVYFNHGQDIRKVKGAEYLSLHRFKNMASLSHTLEMFVEMDYPEHGEFNRRIQETFDFECLQMVIPYTVQICLAYSKVMEILDDMTSHIEILRSLPTRKEQALTIVHTYAKLNMTGLAFAILDNKPILKKDMVKLITQEMEQKGEV